MTEELKLQQRVIDELTFDPAVSAAHIGVSVHGNVVTLSGHVPTYGEKFAAERAAWRVKGVTAVAQELEVRLPEDKKTSDDEIAARVVKILDWDAMLPRGKIKVKVQHGMVTLDGTLEWHYQRTEAENDVRKLTGVKNIINLITVRPSISADDVRSRLLAAFERSAKLDAEGITVDVTEHKIVLRGKVHSWNEREEAERAAWSVPGVTHVDDLITVVRR
jgi:VCBS repeat-containing protein